MTPDDLYRRAQALVHELLGHSASERSALLDAACAGDDDLRREVEWLLVSVEEEADSREIDQALQRSIESQTGEALATACIEPIAPARYRLIERIGEGGMGQVWRAVREQGFVQQRVALKMLHGAGLGTESSLARFLEEGRILGALSHPNIAHLIEAGQSADGSPFLAMECVDGQPIDRWCEDHAASTRERIALFIKVCAAVEYAHAHLIIHRDLKPSNILVNEIGEAKLLDFGIARLIGAEGNGPRAVTATQAMTLAYASPEQIEGRQLGTATDIYSLGIVLYELLSGARPFDHLQTDLARSNAIVSGDLSPPSAIRRRIDASGRRHAMPRRISADLDAIVMKALRREPAQRYASVSEFADDLRAFLASRPVNARRGQLGYRLRRYAWRNRWILAASIFIVAIASVFTWRTVVAEREARLQAEVSDRVAEFLVSVFSASDSQVNKTLTHDLSARAVLDAGAARIDTELADQPRIRARLLEAVGNAYRHMNDNIKGVAMLREAANIHLDPQIDQPVDAARCLEAMANAMANGEFPARDAESAARQSLALAERLTAPGSQTIANAWMVLSLALNRSGDLVAAERAARNTHAFNLKLSESEGNRLDAAIGNLCIILTHRGKLAEAETFCEDSHARRSVLAPHIIQPMALSRLAQLRAAQGEYPAAIDFAEQGLKLTRDLKGERSQFGTIFLVRKAVILDDAGESENALTEFEHALADAEVLNGRDSGEYLDARLQVARHMARTARYAEAIASLREVVPLMTLRYGADDPRSLMARTVLAQALLDSGLANAEVRGLLDAVSTEWSGKDDPDAVDPAYTRIALAQWFVANGDIAHATPLLDQLLAADSRADFPVKTSARRMREQLTGSSSRAVSE